MQTLFVMTVEPTPLKKSRLRDAAGLALMGSIAIVIVGVATLVVLSRHRRQVQREREKMNRPDRLPVSAWKESAKRIRPDEPDESQGEGEHSDPHDPEFDGGPSGDWLQERR